MAIRFSAMTGCEKRVFMFLHLGRDVAVAEDSIIVVFDMDTATWSRHTRNYLTAAEKAGLCDHRRTAKIGGGLP